MIDGCGAENPKFARTRGSNGAPQFVWLALNRAAPRFGCYARHLFCQLFPTRKASGPIAYESNLELELLYLLDATPAVSSIRFQPTRLRYNNAGLTHIHVPDFSYVEGADLHYVEVKPEADVTTAIRRRTVILTNQLAGTAHYHLLTEGHIRVQPRLLNAIRLRDGIGHEPPPKLRQEIRRLLAHSAAFWPIY